MAKTVWPTAAEVTAVLVGAGLTVPGGYTAQDEIDAVIEEIERGTRRKWLPDGSDITVNFDPPTSLVLNLKGGWVSITSITRDVWDGDAGTLLVVGEDYVLQPVTAPDFAKPYTSVEFIYPVTGYPGSLVIVGKRGNHANIPLDLWVASLNVAAGRLARKSTTASSLTQGPVTKKKVGSVEIAYATQATEATSTTTDFHELQLAKLIRFYSRKVAA
jgi:hypothetical protein